MCKSLAERVWAGGEYSGSVIDSGIPQSTYDNCGLNVNGDIKIQSLQYKSAKEFFNEIKPPYFEDYEIQIVDGIDGCFDWAVTFKSTYLFISAFFFTIFIQML